MDITLVYANFPFWRAEVSRVSLFIGDVKFVDRRISSEEFQRAKSKGCLDDGTLIPFRQIPVLVVDGVSVAQTGGIARFCGKLSGLYPKNDDLLAARVDQYIDFMTDLSSLISFSGKNVSEDKKLLNRKKLASGEFKTKLGMLEENISKSGSWLINSKISIADLAVWKAMGWMVSGKVDGFPKNLLDAFPRIKRICKSVDTHPKVLEWISLTYPKNYSRGSFE